jgi:hypothetical protein
MRPRLAYKSDRTLSAKFISYTLSNKLISEMEPLATLTELARASISTALKRIGVELPKHNVQMAPKIAEDLVSIGTPFHYQQLEEAFLYCMDKFEMEKGLKLETDLFEKHQLSADQFKDVSMINIILDQVMDSKDPKAGVGQLLACVAFIVHVCKHQVKAGLKVDEEYVDMVLSSIGQFAELAPWAGICAVMMRVRELEL